MNMNEILPVQEGSEPVQTGQYQISQLVSFAFKLGFVLQGHSFVRVTRNKLLKNVTTLGFNTMCRIFNRAEDAGYHSPWAVTGKYTVFVPRNLTDDPKPLTAIPFYSVDVQDAISRREIRRVKIQMNHKGEVYCLSNKLEFVEEGRGEEFENYVNDVRNGDTPDDNFF